MVNRVFCKQHVTGFQTFGMYKLDLFPWLLYCCLCCLITSVTVHFKRAVPSYLCGALVQRCSMTFRQVVQTVPFSVKPTVLVYNDKA